MIIGINGYIGSGKDTVGQIIQQLTTGIHTNEEQGIVLHLTKSSWEVKKFAAKLKQVASLLTGIPVEKFEDQEFKKSYLGEEWNWFGPSNYGGKGGISTCDIVEKKMTVREFLQKLGTEGVRDGVHTNAWVNALMVDYEEKFNWLVTDTRFTNEAMAIKERGGLVIRINRFVEEPVTGEQYEFYIAGNWEKASYTGWFPSNGGKMYCGTRGPGRNVYCPIIRKVGMHPSENSLDDWPFDYMINNDSDMKKLTLKVKEMLQHFNLLS